MKKINSFSELSGILELFEGHKYFTNAYFFGDELNRLIQSGILYFDLSDKNLLLYKYLAEAGCFEVYYYITDTSSTVNIPNDAQFVMEIPYRSNDFPSAIVAFWEKSGFEKHINRDLLGLIRPNVSEIVLPNPEFEYKLFDNLNLANLIYDSIKSTFDNYTGDILSIDEVISSLKNQEIVAAFEGEKLAGFIRFYTKNKVSWIGHLVVLPEYNGKGIGKSLVAHYLKIRSEQGFANFQQWVISDNVNALKLYSHFGFKPNNKSSISLLKK